MGYKKPCTSFFMKKITIGFDAERMKFPHTGLFHFCKQLGNALIRNQANNNIETTIYTASKNNIEFPPQTPFIHQNSLQKFWLRAANHFDIWHTTFQGTNYFPASANCKLVFTVHDLNFLHDPSKSPKKKQKLLKQLAQKVQRADSVVAISNFVKNELETQIPMGRKPISVIYNGCNISTELMPLAPLPIPEKPFYFSIGTIMEKKNFHVLPKLLPGNNFLLLIAGISNSEDYRELILAEARLLGVEERVRLLGNITEAEKYWYLQNCAALAFPSMAEGFGLPVIEAMYFGKPVLLSTATSLPEIGGPGAWYFQNFEQEHMQQIAEQAIANDSPERQQANAAWAKQFSWDEAARSYLALYKALVNESNK